MSSLKGSMKKRGILTSSEKFKGDLAHGLEKPISPRAGRRSLFVKVGRGSQAAGQGMKVRALVKRMGW